MVKEAKFYTLDSKKMTITVDKSVTPTAADEAMLRTYIGLGYKLREKSAKRAEAMTARANADLKDADIREALKDKPDLLAQYETIRKGKGKGMGFFAAKSWYKANAASNGGKKK